MMDNEETGILNEEGIEVILRGIGYDETRYTLKLPREVAMIKGSIETYSSRFCYREIILFHPEELTIILRWTQIGEHPGRGVLMVYRPEERPQLNGEEI